MLEDFQWTRCLWWRFETAEAPKKLVYISDIFCGYICNFINGPMLCECDDFDFSDVNGIKY